MSPSDFFRSELCQRLVLTLAHSLWQGLLIAGVLAGVAFALRNRSSQARYAVYLMGLVLIGMCLPITFAVVRRPSISQAINAIEPPAAATSGDVWVGDDISSSSIQPAMLPDAVGGETVERVSPVAVAEFEAAVVESSAIEAETAAATSNASVHDAGEVSAAADWWVPATPWLAAAYFAGVLVMLTRVSLALYGAHRLRRFSVPVDDSLILAAVARQARALGLKFSPSVAYCRRVAVPTVVGMLRPVILLPVSFMTALAPDEIETLLAHELAHIRRWDPWINLFQRLVESTLFFNPAVWILSRCISTEREHCCDDLVVRLGAEPARYAESLVHLAELSQNQKASPLATATILQAIGIRSKLGRRVERLLGLHESDRMSAALGKRSLFTVAALAMVTVAVGAWTIGTDPSRSAAARATTIVVSDRNAQDLAADEDAFKDLAPDEVARTWIERVKNSDSNERWDENQRTWDLTNRGNAIGGHLELQELWAKDRVRVAQTLRNDEAAMVVTNVFRDNAGRDRVMRFYLERRDDRWRINRSDFVDASGVAEQIEGFQAHPGVRFHYRIDDLAGRWLGSTQCAGSYSMQFLVLHPDGTFEQTFLGGERVNGTWGIEADTLSITASSGAGLGLATVGRRPQVTELTDEELKISLTLASGEPEESESFQTPPRYWFRRFPAELPVPDFKIRPEAFEALPEIATQLVGMWTRSSMFACWDEVFLPDGTYLFTSNFAAPSFGTWKLEGQTLDITAAPGIRPGEEKLETSRRIVEASESQIVYEYLDDAFGQRPPIGPNPFVYQRVDITGRAAKNAVDEAPDDAQAIHRAAPGESRVELPGGAVVEILAIAVDAQDQERIWRHPSGTRLTPQEFTNEAQYLAAADHANPPQGTRVVRVFGRITPPREGRRSYGMGLPDYSPRPENAIVARIDGIAQDEGPITFLHVLYYRKLPDRLTFGVNVYVGPWEEVGSHDRGAGTRSVDPAEPVTIGDLEQTLEDDFAETRFFVTHHAAGDRFDDRVLVETLDGRFTTAATQVGETIRQGEATRKEYLFSNAPVLVDRIVLERAPMFVAELPEIVLADADAVNSEVAVWSARDGGSATAAAQDDAESTGARTKFTVRVVDESGAPVEGAKVGRFAHVDTRVSPEWRFSGNGQTTDARGVWSAPRDEVFRSETAPAFLYVLHESRRLAAFFEPDRGADEVLLTLAPACRVEGLVITAAPAGLDQENLAWTNVYLFVGDHRPLSFMGETRSFHFLLPPGKYPLHGYGSQYVEAVDQTIDVPKDAATLHVDPLILRPSHLARLVGRTAPELRDIKGWKNGSPVTLADLRGKVVLLDFWGYWCGPCLRAMPKLVDLHNAFGDRGLEIVAVHDDSLDSIAELDPKLEEFRERYWLGRDLPFRIAFDGGGETPIEGTGDTARGATTALYGIRSFPTTLLIDREGTLVGTFNPSDRNALAELEKYIGEPPKPPSWRERFDAVYRLEEGEVLKRIAPPFIPQRAEYYRDEHRYQAQLIAQPFDRMVFDGNHMQGDWGSSLGTSTLENIFQQLTGISRAEIAGPRNVRRLELPGDWMVDPEASRDARIEALARLVREATGAPIRFEPRDVERDVIVVSGTFGFRPLAGTYDDRWIHIYADRLDPDESSGGGSGTVEEFLSRVGERTGMYVANEVQGDGPERVAWGYHRSSSFVNAPETVKTPKDLERLDQVLANLAAQTSLDFRRERRTVRVWFLVSGDADADATTPSEGEASATQFPSNRQVKNVALGPQDHPASEVAHEAQVQDAPAADDAPRPGRRFVRLVVGPEGMTFEGEECTWESLPALLENLPDRASTVFEVAVATEQMTIAAQREAFGRAKALVARFGFEYVSDVGIHPLGSTGSPAEVRPDSKRQRFVPEENSNVRASWGVIGEPSESNPDGWSVLARVPLGGVVPVKFRAEDAERFWIHLLDGDDDAITLRVTTADPPQGITQKVRRDEPAVVSVDGKGYRILYASSYVTPEQPDTSPLAQLFVRPAMAPAFGLSLRSRTDEVVNLAEARPYGLLLRLRADKAEWEAGEFPVFKFLAVNHGSEQVNIFLTQDMGELEVDGQWYRWTGEVRGRASRIRAGDRSRQAKEINFTSDWRTPFGMPLDLHAGAHTFRFATDVQLANLAGGPKVRVVSNPVEITLADDLVAPGAESSGLSVRLTAEETVWPAGKTPAFAAAVRNEGAEAVVVYLAQGVGELEVDGTWYVWRGDVGPLGRDLEPEKLSAEFPVQLTTNWQTRDGSALVLSPGNHRVRFATEARVEGGFPGRTDRVVSNAVEITVADAGDASGSGSASFGPAVECTLAALGARKDCFLDIETGKLLTPPAEIADLIAVAGWPRNAYRPPTWPVRVPGGDAPVNSVAIREWVTAVGADLMVGEDLDELMVLDGVSVSLPVDSGRFAIEFNDAKADDIARGLEGANVTSATRFPPLRSYANRLRRQPGILPTLLFSTRDGNIGVLEILGHVDDPPAVRFRYKLVDLPRRALTIAEGDAAARGIGIRLRPEQPAWNSNEAVMFAIDVQNDGAEFVCSSPFHGWLLEWDGKPFHLMHISREIADDIHVAGGQTVEDLVTLRINVGSEGLEIRALQNRYLQGKFVAIRIDPDTRKLIPNERISLSPGKHTLRIGFPLPAQVAITRPYPDLATSSPLVSQRRESRWLYSPVVEIEIRDEAAGDVNAREESASDTEPDPATAFALNSAERDDAPATLTVHVNDESGAPVEGAKPSLFAQVDTRLAREWRPFGRDIQTDREGKWSVSRDEVLRFGSTPARPYQLLE